MKTALTAAALAVIGVAFAWWSQSSPRDALMTPVAWISIRPGTPPQCFVSTTEHAPSDRVSCGEIGRYLLTKGLPPGAAARITAYSTGGIAWTEVRTVVDSLTAAGYLNAGILTPKAGFINEQPR